jgi:iron complex transport system ATP-binding protein
MNELSDTLLLAAEAIDFSYGEQRVLSGTTLALHEGELVALLGPNGSGKTTLLKLLCGILSPRTGRTMWAGQNIRTAKRRTLAQHIALVPQELNVPFAFTVGEIVGLGRTPHIRPLFGESSRDRQAIALALDLTETRALADRYFGDLSGGERQRVVIAMALAQLSGALLDTRDSRPRPILLLDEPTVHLDINHQVEILELIQRLNRERGLTVLATMHDLNLASLYFDRVILLNDGRIAADGAPQQVLSKEWVERVFRTDVMVQPHPTQKDTPHVVLLPTNGNGKG